MKKEIAEQWIAALRSGKYNQARAGLKTAKGHCCLGVLCELFIEQTGQGSWVDGLSKIFTLEDSYSDIMLPYPVQEWAGIKSGSLVNVEGINYVMSLAGANDRGISFDEISDIIEKNWEDL